MSEEAVDIVIPDTAHVVPPRESNQNDVRSRINDLIARGPDDHESPTSLPNGSEMDSQASALSDLDKPEQSERESDQLGLSDAELESLDTDELDEDLETDQAEQVETLDAKTLAERLEVPIDEIYSMKFPYGEDGESITLGELKDAGIRARGIDAEGESLTNERNDFINDRMKSRSELQNIVALLPEIPPELMQAAQQQQQRAIQNERVSLLEVIPEWSDPGIEGPARKAMAETVGAYGFTEIEMSYMMDHRLVKLLHDYTRLRGKLVEPKAKVSALKKQGGKSPGSRRTRKQRTVDNAKRIGRTDTRGAIDALLPR